ncbi:hypothetical protein ScPMuIL_008482 [Solemya velum]
MPKAKPRRQEADDDASSAASQTSFSQTQSNTQAERAMAGMEPAEQERRTNDLVQYLLIMDQRKVPIKKLDINKQVLKEHSKAFPIIMRSASDKLSKVSVGLKVIEMQDNKQKSYILVNEIEQTSESQHLRWSDEEKSKMGLVMVILSLVFMNGNTMKDSLLWHTLKKMGVDHEHQHEVFGDVKKLVMTEFVRQGYLECIKQPNSDPPAFDFKWGQRSKQETTKRKVLQFVCKVYEKEPQQWTSQWQDLLQSEGTPNGNA